MQRGRAPLACSRAAIEICLFAGRRACRAALLCGPAGSEGMRFLALLQPCRDACVCSVHRRGVRKRPSGIIPVVRMKKKQAPHIAGASSAHGNAAPHAGTACWQQGQTNFERFLFLASRHHQAGLTADLRPQRQSLNALVVEDTAYGITSGTVVAHVFMSPAVPIHAS